MKRILPLIICFCLMVGFIRQQVVEIADEGYVRDVFPLTEEIESVEWMPGADSITSRE